MEFRVLGPLEARGARGEQLPVSAPMLRALLAALVLRAGRVVPVEELARQLWGEDHPLSVPRTLRNYVMRLRKAVGEERILTTSGGYQLEAEWHETDLGRFRDLLRRSRQHTVPPADAAELLDRALDLWRGTPLGGVGDCPLRTAELPRLEEIRLAAVEERFALRLGLGHHEALTDELVAAVRQHPLRERLVSQLMLALYRNRRTAEALAVYREARRTLVRELGIEPGHELRALERAVLRGDKELEVPVLPASRIPAPVPSPPSPSADAPVPGQRPKPDPAPSPLQEETRPPWGFPASLPTFVARSVESARIRELLTGAVVAPAVCLIDGPAGSGKSALAVRAAHEVADQFPDGLLHVDLRGTDPHNPPREPADAVRVLLPALGVPRDATPRDPDAALALYHRTLSGRRVLLLLDNARDTEQIASLVPLRVGAACLVTSRALLTGVEGAHHLHLDVLDSADAVELVRTVSGRRPGAEDEPGAWAELADLCGRLPLALHIIAVRMAARPRWSLRDWNTALRDERGRLDQLVVADRDVRASLLAGVGQLRDSADPLDRAAAALFPLLGAARVSAHTVPSVAALTDREPATAQAELERLTDARVLDSPRPGVYVMHDLVRAVAASEAAHLPEADSRAALERLARWYGGTLHRLNLPLGLGDRHTRRHRAGTAHLPSGLDFATAHEALAWADGAVADVVALARQLAAPAYDTPAHAEPSHPVEPEHALDATDTGGPRRSPLAQGQLSGFALDAATALDGYFALRLDPAHRRTLCELAWAVAERSADRYAMATLLAQLGRAGSRCGDSDEGVRRLRRGIGLFRAVGAREDAAVAMGDLAPCLAARGRYAEAVQVGEAALKEAEHEGLADVAVTVRAHLALCHRQLGDHDRARRLLTANHTAATTTTSRASAAGALAEHHLRSRQFAQAARWAQAAIEHACGPSGASSDTGEVPASDDPFAVAEQHVVLATALEALGRDEEARAAEHRALALLDALESPEAGSLPSG